MENNKKAIKTGWFTAKELLDDTSLTMEYIINPLIPKSIVGAIAGKPGCGKSLLARQLCLSIVKGDNHFLGFPLQASNKRAIYVSTEEGAEALRDWLQKQEFNNEEQKDNLAFLVDDGDGAEKMLTEIREKLKEKPVDLIVIDAFGDIFEGVDGNNNMAMRKALKPFTSLASEFKVALLFIHHTNKSGYDMSPTQAQIQGGSGFVQKVRYALILAEKNGVKMLSLVKHNYASAALKKDAIRLELDEKTLNFYSTGKINVEEVFSQEHTKENEDEDFINLENLADKVFTSEGNTFSYSQVIRTLMDAGKFKISTAKRRLKNMLDLGILIKEGGLYKKVIDQPEEPEDDLEEADDDFEEHDGQPDEPGDE
jgi:RecA-family ATPase